MSPFQSLWLYTRIKREENVQNKAMWDMVKVLAAVINPGTAKEMFREDEDSQETINENFEADLKAIDPGFEMSSCKDIMDGLDQ